MREFIKPISVICYLLPSHRSDHPAQIVIDEFENSISMAGNSRILKRNRFCTKVVFHLLRIVEKTSGINSYGFVTSLLRIFRSANLQSHYYFTIMIGAGIWQCMPNYLIPSRKSIFLFDAWPKDHNRILKMIRALRIKNVFLTSSMAKDSMRKFMPDVNFYWVPEGINPENFKSYTYGHEKYIDVLQFGRKFKKYHDLIVEALERKNICYLYAKEPSALVFPTETGFYDGLARTKISICFPCSITHPERAGDQETMTARYLQSMVSKCLVLGKAPKEMVSLFGYNPVIDCDMQNPVGQIEYILNNFNNYLPLIDKNYKHVITHHTWSNRWEHIYSIIFNQQS